MKLVLAQRGLYLEGRHEAGGMTFEPFGSVSEEWVPEGIVLPEEHAFPRGFVVVIDSPLVVRGDEVFGLKVQAEIDGVLNRLTLAARAPANSAGWWDIPATMLNALNFSEEGMTHSGLVTAETIDHAGSYLEEEVQRNRFALNRYRKAKSEIQDWVDPAVNVAIALEALLMRSVDGVTELTEQICLRGAHLVGGAAADRKVTYDVLRRTYKTRSKVVHSGSIDKPQESMRNETEEALTLFERAAERVLTTGYPSKAQWQDMLLGGS